MSHETPIRVDHVGIAVEAIDAAEPVLFALGCRKLIEESVEGRFRWAQYDFGRDASRLELIAPEAADTFLTAYLDEHGPGLHHVTLEVADIDAVVAALEDAPGTAFDDDREGNGLDREGDEGDDRNGGDLDIVEYREYDDWTEAFVPPSNPTGTLFQLFEYHEGYAEGRPPADHLYVDGTRLSVE